MSRSSLVPVAPPRAGDDTRWPLPEGLRQVMREVDERAARLPTRVNEYGYDPFGFHPSAVSRMLVPMVYAYRHYFRVDAEGVENVPEGRVLVIGNHAGNTFAWDGALVAMSIFLEGTPPRLVRGMAEYFLPTIPFFNVLMHRMGSVVGRPETCKQLLENDEAVMVFPEGERGFVKTYAHAYELQRFGLGFMRLALETDTPIVPVGIVGNEEQSPGIATSRRLGKLIGAPNIPITLTFPLLGLAGFIPFPVKFHLRFGKPLHFEGDAAEDDAEIEKKVEVVKRELTGLIDEGLAARKTWFT